MKKNLILLIVFSCFLTSCFFYKEDGIKLEIVNNSDFQIKNIIFKTSENLDSIKIQTLKPKEKFSAFLSMSKNKSDGSYILEFIDKENKKNHRNSGYYTNGYSLNHLIEIEVENDTTLVKFDYPIY